MRFLLCSIFLTVTACTSSYRGMTPATGKDLCAQRMKPDGIASGWFTAGVDVMGRRISGLLVIKKIEDGETRVVMTSEAGVTFFDFGFKPGGEFKVHRIIPQLDRKVVINLLRDDFGLLLGIPFREKPIEARTLNDELYFAAPQKKETAYFITDPDCSTLLRLERASSRKRLVSITFEGDAKAPEAAVIRHHTFEMVITLRKIEK